MRAGSLVLLGIAAYVVFLVATMPASWLESRLAAGAPGRYEVQEMTGTIWKGSARAVVRLPAATLTLDRVDWAFRPARLLQGELAFAIALAGTGFDAAYEAGRSLAGWSVRDFTARADMGAAAVAMPLAARWRPEGRLTAAAPAIRIDAKGISGDVRLDLKNAATSLSEVRPLGSYRMDFNADGPGAKVGLTTEDGPLRLVGTGRLDWPTRLAFSGEARATGPNAAALTAFLDMLGPARPDGARALEWRMR